jgi:hypothetical protein
MSAHRLALRLFAVLAAGVVSAAAAPAGPVITYGVSSDFQQRGLLPLWGQLQAGPGGFVDAQAAVENTITVGSASRTTGGLPMLLPRRFELDVTIFDQVSGLSGTLEFEGFANERVEIFSLIPFRTRRQAQFFGLDELGGNSLTFGSRTYDVALTTREGPNGMAYVDANVTVNTPEPGTLVLAGIGLSLPAAGWLRRRVRG